MPDFIPVLANGLPSIPLYRRDVLFGVSLGKILRRNGDLRVNTAEQLRSFLQLPQDARLALIGTADDYLLERFWKITDTQNLWTRIAKLGFEFVTSCTFSVWDRQARADQIHNQDRNFFSFDALASEGLPTIPFLFFYDHSDYRHNISWLQNHPDVKIVAMLAHCKRSHEGFKDLLGEMATIVSDIQRPLKFLVVGVSSKNKIDLIISKFDASIATSDPFMSALKGGDLISPELKRVGMKDFKIPRERLALENVNAYLNFIEARKNRQRT